MRMVLILLAAVMLGGGCIHIDVHETEEITTTNNSSEEVQIQDD